MSLLGMVKQPVYFQGGRHPHSVETIAQELFEPFPTLGWLTGLQVKVCPIRQSPHSDIA